MKIVQLTDLHIGEFTDKTYINYIVETINREKPDLILMTGDIISQKFSSIKDQALLLKNLKSKYGKYAVLGNREMNFNREHFYKKLFLDLDIQLLCKTKERITIEGFSFFIGGINDSKLQKTKHLKKFLSSPSIFLAHQPKSALFLRDIPDTDLMLCGHTHGGQVRPFGTRILKEQRQPFFKGLFQVGKTKIYVSEGAGYTLVPIRFLTKGEITSITINKG